MILLYTFTILLTSYSWLMKQVSVIVIIYSFGSFGFWLSKIKAES